MVKTILFCRRRPELTHHRYVECVLHEHVPLALRHHSTMQRCVLNVVEGARPGAPPVDSIAELGFATLADFTERLYDSLAGERALARGVARFLGATDAYATTEHVHKDALRKGSGRVDAPGGGLVEVEGNSPF